MTYLGLTGATGFVANSLKRYFGTGYCFKEYTRNSLFKVSDEHVVLHFAGISHDVEKVTSSEEYYRVNTSLTKEIFDSFLTSNATVFIILSSVKAAADEVSGVLTEDDIPNPKTHYGKSKLLAEKYIISHSIPKGKRVYILRPCLIYGPGNNANLKFLYNFVSKGFPWPLGTFDNKRSYCSIENLCFVIKELIERNDITSGIYNISDDEPLSTNELINLISESINNKSLIWKIPRRFILFLVRVGDYFRLSFNSNSFQKLTDSYIVSNQKIKTAIGKNLPVSSREGLLKTFISFKSQ